MLIEVYHRKTGKKQVISDRLLLVPKFAALYSRTPLQKAKEQKQTSRRSRRSGRGATPNVVPVQESPTPLTQAETEGSEV